MPVSEKAPPYFSRLMAQLEAGEPSVTAAFGRHVHWGYWNDSAHHCTNPKDYGEAAERLTLELLQLANIESNTRVLDAGCGLGGTIDCLNRRLHDAVLVGLNIDPRQLQYAAGRIGAKNDNAIQFMEGNAENLPFSDATFNHVLAVECVFHFEREKFFAEAARVLHLGGTLTLSDFVPAERTAELLGPIDLSANEAVRSAYGQIDIGWSVSRYRQLAHRVRLELKETRDITPHTLPTYGFLQQSVEDWEDPAARGRFLAATSLLEKASRRNLMEYQLLRFEKA